MVPPASVTAQDRPHSPAMEPSEVRAYVERVTRQQQRWRRVWPVAAALLVVSGLALVVFGPQMGCHYIVAREGVSVPDLRGMTFDGAREHLDDCIPLTVVGERAAPDAAPGSILEQHPEPPGVLNDRRPVEVVVAVDAP